MKVRKAVIPVAGLGTRFLPATKAIPKEMLTIVDRPTIQYIVEEVVASGIEQVIFVTSEGKSAIANHFDYNFHLDSVLKEKNKTILVLYIKLKNVRACGKKRKQCMIIKHLYFFRLYHMCYKLFIPI